MDSLCLDFEHPSSSDLPSSDPTHCPGAKGDILGTLPRYLIKGLMIVMFVLSDASAAPIIIMTHAFNLYLSMPSPLQIGGVLFMF